RHYEHTLPNIRGSLSNTYLNYTTGIVSEYKIKEEENRMKPPVTYSHPKSVIVMIHMTGGTEMPFRSDGSSYAEATSEARSGVEKRAGFRFLVHRSFLILMGRRESAHPSGYGFLNYRSMGV
ncbi:MAG: hypothetical protein ACLTFX_04760, partial [Phocaeicola vulgatus]